MQSTPHPVLSCSVLSEADIGLEEEPCDPTTPEPPEEAMEPSQPDPATNSLAPLDPIPAEYPSTALPHQPSKHKPPPTPPPETDASPPPINCHWRSLTQILTECQKSALLALRKLALLGIDK